MFVRSAKKSRIHFNFSLHWHFFYGLFYLYMPSTFSLGLVYVVQHYFEIYDLLIYAFGSKYFALIFQFFCIHTC